MKRHLGNGAAWCLLSILFCSVGFVDSRVALASTEAREGDSIKVVVTRHDGTPIEGIGVVVLGHRVIESPSSFQYHELPRAVTDASGSATVDGIDHEGRVHVQLADAAAFIGESPDKLRDLTARFRSLSREVPVRSTYPLDVPANNVLQLRLDEPAMVRIRTEEAGGKLYPTIATWEGSSPRVYAAPLKPDSEGFVVFPVPADRDALVIASFKGSWLIEPVSVPAGETREVVGMSARRDRASKSLTLEIDASPAVDYQSAMGYSNLVTVWSRESGVAVMGRYMPSGSGFVFMQPDGTFRAAAELPAGTLVAAMGGPLFLGWAIHGFGAQASAAFGTLLSEGRSDDCLVFAPAEDVSAVQLGIDEDGLAVRE